MRLLLDTHVLLWWLADDPTLAPPAAKAIADGSATVWVSAATAWEIAIKQALGKLTLPGDLAEALTHNRFQSLSISTAHALKAGALPRHHDDPFDRMLIAQAQLEGLTLVTRDERIAPYGIKLMQA